MGISSRRIYAGRDNWDTNFRFRPEDVIPLDDRLKPAANSVGVSEKHMPVIRVIASLHCAPKNAKNKRRIEIDWNVPSKIYRIPLIIDVLVVKAVLRNVDCRQCSEPRILAQVARVIDVVGMQ